MATTHTHVHLGQLLYIFLEWNWKLQMKIVCRKRAYIQLDRPPTPTILSVFLSLLPCLSPLGLSCRPSLASLSPSLFFLLFLSLLVLVSTRKLRILWQISCLCSIKSIEAFNIANLSDTHPTCCAAQCGRSPLALSLCPSSHWVIDYRCYRAGGRHCSQLESILLSLCSRNYAIKICALFPSPSRSLIIFISCVSTKKSGLGSVTPPSPLATCQLTQLRTPQAKLERQPQPQPHPTQRCCPNVAPAHVACT